jgi:hypothetical protein
MSSTGTVAEFAAELNKSTANLIEQLTSAGVATKTPGRRYAVWSQTSKTAELSADQSRYRGRRTQENHLGQKIDQ